MGAMPADYSNDHDRQLAGRYEARESDWRNGAVVYQVIVDRFAPSAHLAAKAGLYPEPKRLRSWEEAPSRGVYLTEHEVWSHELDFWGGDIDSLRRHLDYVANLGAEVVYLCPIHLAWTNHGYDALDYQQVRPEYGSREDVRALAADLHSRGMRLVLDGVFNHMGRHSPAFRAAAADPAAATRGWFDFNDDYPGGARAWAEAVNLPELVIEEPTVREYLWQGPDSVVRSWLRDGVDGWRLDVAFEIGMAYLGELTAAAHDEKPGSLVLGEVCNYPAEWFPALDAVLAFTLREIILKAANHDITPGHAQRMLQRLYTDADYEHLLKCWVYLDNHDVARVTDTVPDAAARRLATVLQFTLPGSVNLYYGSELGQTGGDDPANRAPMPWNLVNNDNPTLDLHRRLIELRRTRRALRVGDVRWLETDRLLGFERHTDRAADALVVLVNPSVEPVLEAVLLPDSKLMDIVGMRDLLTGQHHRNYHGMIAIELAPQQVVILSPQTTPHHGYTPYKRVQ